MPGMLPCFVHMKGLLHQNFRVFDLFYIPIIGLVSTFDLQTTTCVQKQLSALTTYFDVVHIVRMGEVSCTPCNWRNEKKIMRCSQIDGQNNAKHLALLNVKTIKQIVCYKPSLKQYLLKQNHSINSFLTAGVFMIHHKCQLLHQIFSIKHIYMSFFSSWIRSTLFGRLGFV